MAKAQQASFDEEVPVIEAIQAGDRYAFSELVRRHEGWIRGVVFGVLGSSDSVDDVVQQVWTCVWQRIGELRDCNRWRPWVYRLARNAAIDGGRDATRRRKHFQAMAVHAGPAVSMAQPAGPQEASAAQDKHAVVLAALQALPTLYREPFVLRHLSGWTYRQIAEVMGMPVDSVETRLVRARRLLRESLKDKV